MSAAGLWDKRTPLMRAAIGGHVEFLKLLIEKKADLNACHNDGSTALMLAVKQGQLATATELVAAGADTAVKDGWRHDGPTALGLANAAGSAALADMLKNAGAKE